MSFLFAGTQLKYNPETFLHHQKGYLEEYTDEQFSVYVHTSQKIDSIAHKGNCMVAVLGEIEHCTPQQLLERYLKEGIDVCTSLFGSFVVLIHHGSRIFLIRDPMGLQTVYYREGEGGQITISSDPVALQKNGSAEPVSLQKMYFQTGHLPFGIQHWGDMIQLQPGTWMSKLSSHLAQQVSYYQLPEKRIDRGDFDRVLYYQTLSRIVSDTQHIQHMIPERNITSVVLLQILHEQRRRVFLYGLEGDEWVNMLGEHFSMPVRYIQRPESMLETQKSARWYVGAPFSEPKFLRTYALSSVLQDKEVYIPIEESFGGHFIQRFFLLAHYFPKEWGDIYLKACQAGSDWSFLPKLARERDLLSKRIKNDLMMDGVRVLDRLLRLRVVRWGGMSVLPMYRAMFPLAHFPLFDERLVRLSFEMPTKYIMHQGKSQHYFWKSYAKGLPQNLCSILRKVDAQPFALDEDCREAARKKLYSVPLTKELQTHLETSQDPRMDRLLWYILNY